MVHYSVSRGAWICVSLGIWEEEVEGEEKNLSFYIFILLKMVWTGSPLLLGIKIIHILLLSLEVTSQKGG